MNKLARSSQNLTFMRRFDRFYTDITDSPDLLARLLIVITVYVLIMIPAIYVLWQWIDGVFNSTGPIDIAGYLFEALVIAVVFMFGVAVLYAVVYSRPELHIAVSFISFVLVFLGAMILGEMSNKCILDLDCSLWKYIAGLLIVTAVNLAAYLLPRKLNPTKAYIFAFIAFLALAFTQSDLWLFNAYRYDGIPLTWGAVRALFLLFYSVIWVGLFVSGARKEEPEKRDPYTWS